MAPDELDTAQDRDIQARLMHITQENQAIKAQLSKLTELAWHLLPQQPHATQATPQPTDASNPSLGLPPAKDQSPGTPGAALSFPPPSWSQLREATSGESSGDLRAVHQSPAGQSMASASCASLPTVSALWHHWRDLYLFLSAHSASLDCPTQPRHDVSSSKYWSPATSTYHQSASCSGPHYHPGNGAVQ